MDFFDQFFRDAPSMLDLDLIRNQWLSIRPFYDVTKRLPPYPVWARRRYTADGLQAWNILCKDLHEASCTKPFCIYIHVPFCSTRCSFCDCYAFPLKNHQDRHAQRYAALIKQEIATWSAQGNLSNRPVSTIHFGGGTPLMLGQHLFAEVVMTLRDHFSTSSLTELALETTSLTINVDQLDFLMDLGFKRLHIGVQSLEDDVRGALKRHETSQVVLEKIKQAVERGMIVSVDIIVGLPHQTLNGLLRDLQLLVEAGVEGFSIYEIQFSLRNEPFIKSNNLDLRDRTLVYFMYQAAYSFLESVGYRKNLFNHLARYRDTDLYFTFPQRNEDCLAIGTIADGVFGDYHYRHPEYRFYLDKATVNFPGLEGGMRKNDLENIAAPLETAIMSASFTKELLERTTGKTQTNELLSKWQSAGLIRPIDKTGYILTNTGSWLVGIMLDDIWSLLVSQNDRLANQ